MEILRRPPSYFATSGEMAAIYGHVPKPPGPPQRPIAETAPADPITSQIRELEEMLSNPVGRMQAPQDSAPWPLRKYAEVYAGPKDKPVILREEHVEKIDAVRGEFNGRRVYEGEKPLTTTDVVNACLDFIFSHLNVSFPKLQAREDLAMLISDHIYRTALSHWRQFNEI